MSSVSQLDIPEALLFTPYLVPSTGGPVNNVDNRVEHGDGVGGPPVANSQLPPANQLIRHCVETLKHEVGNR